MLRGGFDVLLDDRVISPGAKFKDNDLLGIPYKLIIGERGLKNSTVELEHRNDGRKEIIALNNIVKEFAKRK